MRLLFLLVALLAGCAVPPERRPEESPAAPPLVPALPPYRESVAVAGLMDGARAESAAGNLAGAAASLERALRIEPRNPRLWHELARVRFRQGQHAQAESFAARSNSWASDDKPLRAENWRLIAAARNARGDKEGARAAQEQANR